MRAERISELHYCAGCMATMLHIGIKTDTQMACKRCGRVKPVRKRTNRKEG